MNAASIPKKIACLLTCFTLQNSDICYAGNQLSREEPNKSTPIDQGAVTDQEAHADEPEEIAKEQVLVRCIHCSESYNRSDLLLQHIKEAHDVAVVTRHHSDMPTPRTKKTAIKTKTIVCPYQECRDAYSCSSTDEMLQHVRKVHQQASASEHTDSTEEEAQEDGEYILRY